MTNNHQLAMAHYENCAGEASDEIQQAMTEMQSLYQASPTVLEALEDMAELVEASLVFEEVSREAWEEQLNQALCVIAKAKQKGL